MGVYKYKKGLLISLETQPIMLRGGKLSISRGGPEPAPGRGADIHRGADIRTPPTCLYKESKNNIVELKEFNGKTMYIYY